VVLDFTALSGYCYSVTINFEIGRCRKMVRSKFENRLPRLEIGTIADADLEGSLTTLHLKTGDGEESLPVIVERTAPRSRSPATPAGVTCARHLPDPDAVSLRR
jgi:hypothetical protein